MSRIKNPPYLLAPRRIAEVSLPLTMRYAPHSGSRTSKDAAADIRKHLPRLEGRVLVFIASRATGATAQQIGDSLMLEGDTVRPRLVELRERKLIKDSGRTRKTRSGRNATVWEITR